jgi:hypothetical protein
MHRYAPICTDIYTGLVSSTPNLSHLVEFVTYAAVVYRDELLHAVVCSHEQADHELLDQACILLLI